MYLILFFKLALNSLTDLHALHDVPPPEQRAREGGVERRDALPRTLERRLTRQRVEPVPGAGGGLRRYVM